MTPRTATQRGDLAEEVLPVAAHLSLLVHGDGGDRDIQQAIARLDAAQRDALIVVLAALADPDRPLGALLGWVDFDERGRPAEPDLDDRTTLRQIADEYPLWADGPDIDEVAVRRALTGEPVPLTPRERTRAVEVGILRGLSYGGVADALGMTRAAVEKSWDRTKKKRRAAGLPVPEIPVNEIRDAS